MLAQRVPVRRGGAGRPARGAAGAAGLDHEGARRGLHEPPARRLHPLRRRRGDRPDHGDARRAGADLRARHVPAARAEHAGARRRLPRALSRRARAGDATARTMRERGVVIASGLMAGGALGGVFGAALRLVPGFTRGLDPDARSSTSRRYRRPSRRCSSSACACTCGAPRTRARRKPKLSASGSRVELRPDGVDRRHRGCERAVCSFPSLALPCAPFSRPRVARVPRRHQSGPTVSGAHGIRPSPPRRAPARLPAHRGRSCRSHR